ncbi:hypothetical protein MD484_g6082, partial [Candolleomyces efflorescens]
MKLPSFGIALTCFFTAVSAKIDLAAPINPVSGGRSTVTWTHDASDPSQFILMLQLASDSWATGQFWYYTETSANKLDVTWLNTWPYVITPVRSIYRLTARNQSNVDQVLSRSPDFRFLPPAGGVTTTSTTSSTSSRSSSVSTKPVTSSTKSTISSTNSTSNTKSTTSVSTSTAKISTTSTSSPFAAPTTSMSAPINSLQPTTSSTSEPISTITEPDPPGATGGVLGNNNNAASGLPVNAGAALTVALLLSLGSSFF